LYVWLCACLRACFCRPEALKFANQILKRDKGLTTAKVKCMLLRCQHCAVRTPAAANTVLFARLLLPTLCCPLACYCQHCADPCCCAVPRSFVMLTSEVMLSVMETLQHEYAAVLATPETRLKLPNHTYWHGCRLFKTAPRTSPCLPQSRHSTSPASCRSSERQAAWTGVQRNWPCAEQRTVSSVTVSSLCLVAAILQSTHPH
jgi:hypothetical protein